MNNHNDLGTIDAAWRGFVLKDGELHTPNGYHYPPGYVLAIPIDAQRIAHLKALLRCPQQWLL